MQFCAEMQQAKLLRINAQLYTLKFVTARLETDTNIVQSYLVERRKTI